jgi:hypothetical protein
MWRHNKSKAGIELIWLQQNLQNFTPLSSGCFALAATNLASDNTGKDIALSSCKNSVD